MITYRTVLVLLALLVSYTPLPSSADVPADFTSRLDGFIRCVMSDRWPFGRNSSTPELAVTVVANNRVIFSAGYGNTSSGAPITADTLFAIGSISKAFTSTVAGMLAEQGRLELSEPISRLGVPLKTYDAYIDREASLRDLFTHRTGISRNDFIGIFHQTTGVDWHDMIKYYVPLLRPVVPFRYEYQYNNWMIAQAAAVIETLIDTPWSDYITNMLLTPLRMHNTSTTWQASLKGNRATAYKAGPSAAVPFVEVPAEADAQIDLFAPAGAIHSTANDMSKWLLFQLGQSPQMINQSTLDYLHTASVNTVDPSTPFTGRGYFTAANSQISLVQIGYGYNWIEMDWNGYAAVEHNGATLGFISDLWHFPNEGFGWWIGTPAVSGRPMSAVDLWIGLELLGETNVIDALCKADSTSREENAVRWEQSKHTIEPLLAQMDERRQQHSLSPSQPVHPAFIESETASEPLINTVHDAAVELSDLVGTYTDLTGPFGVINITLNSNSSNNATYPLLLMWETAQMLLTPSTAAGSTPNVYSAAIIAPAAIAIVYPQAINLLRFDVDSTSGVVMGMYYYLATPTAYLASAAHHPIIHSSSSSTGGGSGGGTGSGSGSGSGDSGGSKMVQLIVVLCIVSIILLAVLSYALLVTKRYNDLKKTGGGGSGGSMHDSLLSS